MKNTRIVEIGVIKVLGGEIVDEYNTLVNPGMHIPAEASRVNRIYDNDVAGAPGYSDIAGKLAEMLIGQTILGYNVTFDLAFIKNLFEKCYISGEIRYFDVLYYAKRILPKLKDLPDWAIARKFGKAEQLRQEGKKVKNISEVEYLSLIENAQTVLRSVQWCPTWTQKEGDAMNNEEKIFQMLEQMRADMTEMKADMTEMKATQKKQGELLEEIDIRSARTQVLLETDFKRDLQLLFEGHQNLLDTLAPKPRVEALEEEVDTLKTVVRLLTHDVAELKKAQ